MPLLTDGGAPHTLVYYGGTHILPKIKPWTLRWVQVICMISAIFQLTLFIYKKVKSKQLTQLQQLKTIMSENLLNIYGMVSFLICSLIPIILFIVFSCVKLEPEVLLPHAIMALSGCFMFIQARVFARNRALRYYPVISIRLEHFLCSRAYTVKTIKVTLQENPLFGGLSRFKENWRTRRHNRVQAVHNVENNHLRNVDIELDQDNCVVMYDNYM